MGVWHRELGKGFTFSLSEQLWGFSARAGDGGVVQVHPGFLAQVPPSVARTGVSARGAPAQRPSCGQGGRGGGLSGWCWETGGAPVVKQGVAPGTGQQRAADKGAGRVSPSPFNPSSAR